MGIDGIVAADLLRHWRVIPSPWRVILRPITLAKPLLKYLGIGLIIAQIGENKLSR
jgi:hypothetical protein